MVVLGVVGWLGRCSWVVGSTQYRQPPSSSPSAFVLISPLLFSSLLGPDPFLSETFVHFSRLSLVICHFELILDFDFFPLLPSSPLPSPTLLQYRVPGRSLNAGI